MHSFITKDSFDLVPPPPGIVIDDGASSQNIYENITIDDGTENMYENITMDFAPPPPETSPPELPTFREENDSKKSDSFGFNRMSMIPEPDFDF